MKLIVPVLVVLFYALGLAGSITWATHAGATRLLGLLLWTSFFGFCMVTTLMLYWSREHWLD